MKRDENERKLNQIYRWVLFACLYIGGFGTFILSIELYHVFGMVWQPIVFITMGMFCFLVALLLIWVPIIRGD